MARTEVREVIKEAVNNQQPQSHQSTSESPTDNPLAKARNQLKRSTKLYAASGIVEGLNELLVGDFSGIEEELEIAVDEFSERVAHPKSSDLEIAPSSPSFFALAPAE
ncbi:hypothetical protein Lepto7376_3684 [[Leptolyngbya] sp. PCC 7376]|uniref:hypothetical protein n=1 Tax=[Leptolyngbya] sp. PCC 7376 TaxID=111781 RepID=UPI00029F4B57|nr:hypothetical protein [[Leptolyngbya] sp. PCC 7376]AFY39860.1 hypothetical protein Lepto7376_3684 [[Leptolyngbya] sp. PCC 7376]